MFWRLGFPLSLESLLAQIKQIPMQMLANKIVSPALPSKHILCDTAIAEMEKVRTLALVSPGQQGRPVPYLLNFFVSVLS